MAKPKTITEKQLQSNAKQWAVACECNDEQRYIQFKTDKMFSKGSLKLEASRYAKQITGWTKNELLLYSWSKFIALEEAKGEQIFGQTVGQHLGQMTRLEILEMFVPYLQDYIEFLKEGESE